MAPTRDLRWLLPLVLSLFALAVSAFTSYAKNDREMVQRLTKVEAHVDDDRETLKDIKAKVDQILILVRSH
jgi:hypothetical protein